MTITITFQNLVQITVQTCVPSTREAEQEDQEHQTGLGYTWRSAGLDNTVKSCFKKKKTEQNKTKRHGKETLEE